MLNVLQHNSIPVVLFQLHIQLTPFPALACLLFTSIHACAARETLEIAHTSWYICSSMFGSIDALHTIFTIYVNSCMYRMKDT